jgi:hypothetical protein
MVFLGGEVTIRRVSAVIVTGRSSWSPPLRPHARLPRSLLIPSPPVLDPADLRAYASRDWDALARLKEEACSSLSPAEGILLGEALRLHARAVNPAWPTARQRRADRAAHLRLLDALARTPAVGR